MVDNQEQGTDELHKGRDKNNVSRTNDKGDNARIKWGRKNNRPTNIRIRNK